MILFYILFLSACKNNPASDKTSNEVTDSLKTDKKSVSDIENKMLDKLSKLPEWMQANHYIDSLTNHKHSLSVITENPNKDNADYHFQAGYNHDDHFETYFHFYMNPKTFEIKIMDLVNGDIVPMEVWRKREEKRNKK